MLRVEKAYVCTLDARKSLDFNLTETLIDQNIFYHPHINFITILYNVLFDRRHKFTQ